jgi:flagellar biosynthetic protein FliO
MRHNSSLSYRAVKKISLVFFLLLIIISALNIQPLNAQNQSAQGASTQKVSGQNNAAGQGGVSSADNNVKVPGQGFMEEDFKPKVEEESIAWMIIKTILVLALFIGGFYMFFKFVTQKAGLHISGQEAVQILSTVPVGTNKFIQIIDVAGKVFLIGVSDNNISLLTEIKDRVDIDRIRLLSSKSTPVHGNSFQDFISAQIGWVIDKINEKRNRGSRKVMMEDITDKEFDMSYLNKQKSRLKNIDGNGDE